MIISHKYKFIFVKTRKTAGTSIEIALSKFCDEGDIITPQVSEDPKNPLNVHLAKDEQIRIDKGYTSARNYYVPYSGYSLKQWRRLVLRGIRAQYKKHSPALYIRSHFPDIWNSYFKFCVERNPWDKAVSVYYWFLGARNGQGPMHSCLSADLRRVSNWYIYAIDGKPAVDHVIQYDHLNDELDRIAEQLKFPDKLDLPRAKGDYRKDRRDYRDVIDVETRALIDKVCEKEIAYFGYKYDP